MENWEENWEQTLIERLRGVDDELETVIGECELADGHLLHQWSAELDEHAKGVWPADSELAGSAPAWAMNLPLVSGALHFVAKNLQAIEDARIAGERENEVAARDRVFIYAHMAKAGAWCLRRALVEHTEAPPAR